MNALAPAIRYVFVGLNKVYLNSIMSDYIWILATKTLLIPTCFHNKIRKPEYLFLEKVYCCIAFFRAIPPKVVQYLFIFYGMICVYLAHLLLVLIDPISFAAAMATWVCTGFTLTQLTFDFVVLDIMLHEI